MLLAKCMQLLQRISDVPFSLTYLVMDPGYNQSNRQKIMDNAELLEIPVTVFDSGIPAISVPGCGGEICMPKRRSWDAIRSLWAIILMM